jgi:hypothetical protein
MDIGLDAVGNGDIPSFVVANDTDTALVATIVVTPNYDNNGFTCVGDPETFTITVNPGAQVNPVLSQELCIGDSTDEIVFTTTNTDGATTYAWTNDNPAIGLAASGDGNIDSFTPSLVTTSQIATIVVTPTYENNGVICEGSPETFTITVNPEPDINNVTETICNEGTFTTVLPSDGTNGDVVPSVGRTRWNYISVSTVRR